MKQNSRASLHGPERLLALTSDDIKVGISGYADKMIVEIFDERRVGMELDAKARSEVSKGKQPPALMEQGSRGPEPELFGEWKWMSRNN